MRNNWMLNMKVAVLLLLMTACAYGNYFIKLFLFCEPRVFYVLNVPVILFTSLLLFFISK